MGVMCCDIILHRTLSRCKRSAAEAAEVWGFEALGCAVGWVAVRAARELGGFSADVCVCSKVVFSLVFLM
jgi:hypothetical protein